MQKYLRRCVDGRAKTMDVGGAGAAIAVAVAGAAPVGTGVNGAAPTPTGAPMNGHVATGNR